MPGTQAALNITAIDHTAGTLTVTAHGRATGDGPVALFASPTAATLGVVPTGLSSNTDYWLIRVDANTLKLADSNPHAIALTAVTFSDNGTLPLQLLVGIPYRNPRTYAPGVQLFSADLVALWATLIALWNWITGQIQTVFDGLTLAGALKVGGQAYTFTNFTFTADSTTDTCTATAHPLHTGAGPIRNSNSGGGAPGGLPVATDWYAIKIDANTFKAATSRANAIAGVAIDITSNGTGTQTVQVQAGTTRITDCEVTRNLTVDGNATISGTETVGGLITANGGVTAGANKDVTLSGTGTVKHGTWTKIIQANINGNNHSWVVIDSSTIFAWDIHLDPHFQVGDIITAVRANCSDNVGGTRVGVTIQTTTDGTAAEFTAPGGAQQITSGTAGALHQLQFSLSEAVVAGKAIRVNFVPSGGSASVTVWSIEVDWTR